MRLRTGNASKRAPRDRGSMLVMVLVMIAMAAVMMGRFLDRTSTELLVEGREVQADRLRVEAQSALEAVLAVLADYRAADGALHAPEQGWSDALEESGFEPAEGTTIETEFVDESGKLSLPRMDEGALRELGEILGLSMVDAARFADALLIWTRPDHASGASGIDVEAYERADPPHVPPGRPLRSFDELAAIAGARDYFYDEDGEPTELRDAFIAAVSLYDFAASNVNAAGPVTLAVAGFTESQVAALQRYLDGGTARPPGSPPYFRSVAEAAALLGTAELLAGFGTEVNCLRVTVSATEGPTQLRLTAVVEPPGVAGGVGDSLERSAAEADDGDGAARLNYPFDILDFEETLEALNPPSL